MEDKTLQQTEALALLCPTCGARYTLPKYVEGQKYGCKRCSASLMFGKFALQQELGRGGFGVVYKAFQADLQRIVALKFLHTDSAESTERFMREARIAANLSHPNITAIYEVGQHDGKPYITMQFVDGITTNKASFSIREAVSVVRDAAVAVDYAHARDVIHRDIKPHNIMITQERSGTSPSDMNRRTFVMDFGLARSANKGGTLTTEGQVMGTPAFMSPEQAEGRTCDSRSDVYSLGATLYSLVAKRPPFEAPTPLQILMQVTQQDPPLPSQLNPEIDKGLEAVIMKAMAKDPAQRYPSASRFAQDLTSWMAGGVTDAGPTVHLSMTPGSLKAAQARKKKQGTMVAVGLALIIAGAAGLTWRVLSQAPGQGAVVRNPLPADPVPRPADPVIPVVPIVPVPTKVLLDVRTEPADATLRIENKEWRTPVVLNETQIAPGSYEIVVSKPGFKPIKDRVTLTAGQSTVIFEKKLEREARKVAFTVASEPPGATVFLNGNDTGGKTPLTVYEDELGGAVAQVELELEGYVPARRSFEPTGGETKRVALTQKTGTFVVNGPVSGTFVHLLPIPRAVKNVRAVAGLWSENPELLEQAVAALDAADVPFVVERLKTLTARPEPKIRQRAATLAGTPGSPTPVKPEKSLTADGRGSVRFENAWVQTRYRILATSPRTLDFLSDELEPRLREEISIKAEMTVLATVSAAGLRPALGKFKVVQADQSVAGLLAPGEAALRVTAGPVQLQYQPPAGEPFLREFSIDVNVADRADLSGSLYRYCAEAWERDRNVPMALRCYQKLLEEKQFPTSEQPERAKLPERMRVLYKGWIDAAEKAGKALGGDLAGRLDEARKKAAADAIPALMELYAAKDATPEIRGGAAGALAMICAKESQPYEAVEWAERSVREKVDAGHDTAGRVVAASKGYPGLSERVEGVTAALEALRKPPPPKPDPATANPPTPAPGGRAGVLQV
ncbi:MAG: serine/threonine protein kinase, partial [Planctomycetaceae bacterium]|nr:serine/threonine protein kinase [Planctomycetaceae bacterium]